MRTLRTVLLGLLIGGVILLVVLVQERRAERYAGVYFPGFLRHMAAQYRYRQAHADRPDDLPSVYYLALAANLDPDDPNVWSELCVGMARDGLRVDAPTTVLVCRRALELRPDAADYQALGVAYQARRAYREAADSFSRANQLQPGNPLTVHNLMIARLELKQYAEAASTGEAFFSLGNAVASGHALELEDINAELGYAYQQLGRMKEAQAAYARTRFSGCTAPAGPAGALNCKLRSLPPDLATRY